VNKFVEVLSNSFFARFYRAISVFLEYIRYRKNPNKRNLQPLSPVSFVDRQIIQRENVLI
jgi:hypothetical protein